LSAVSPKGKEAESILERCFWEHTETGNSTTEKGLREAVDRLKPFFTDKSPFENPPKISEKIQWVKPAFVCEVAFAEWTSDEQLRQTTFLRWRDDKGPKRSSARAKRKKLNY
jgi:bifunctional non-homologous end joining protein LigD